MVSIENWEELLSYLLDRGFIHSASNTQVEYFSSGVSGTAAMASEGGAQILVKQALARLKVAEPWECAPQRLRVEI